MMTTMQLRRFYGEKTISTRRLTTRAGAVLFLFAGVSLIGLICLLVAKNFSSAMPEMASGRGAAKMEVKLTLERTEIIVGESTTLAITITNATNQSLEVLDPERNEDWPKIRVREVQSRQENVYGPHDREKQGAEFTVPIPLTYLTLAPGKRAERRADLRSWVGALAPGKYELSAVAKSAEDEAASPAVALAVQPLNLRSSQTASSHSGYNPQRYCVWSHAVGQGSAIVLTGMNFDPEGHAVTTQSFRVADTDRAAAPNLSVSPNNFPYPAHWLAWLGDGQLFGLYVKQGRVLLPARSFALNLAGQTAIIPPILLTPPPADNQTAQGSVALWHSQNETTNELIIRTFEPDGSLGSGPTFPLAAGVLRWGQAVYLSHGERRFALAVERGNETRLDLLRWSGKNATTGHAAPINIARWAGRVLGSGMTLNQEDALNGTTVVQTSAPDTPPVYVLQNWRVDANGAGRVEPAVQLKLHSSVVLVRALIEVSPQGKTLALLQTSDQRWCWCDGSGVCFLLPPAQLAPYGVPVGAFWLNGSTPLLLMAGAQTGIAYRNLPVMKK